MASPAHLPASRWGAGLRIVLAALAFGVATGLLHAAVLQVEHFGFGRFTWFSREFPWMAPVAYTVVFLVGAIPLLLAAVVRPALATPQVVAWWFGAAMTFGLLLPWSQLGRLASLVLAAGVATQLARSAGRRAATWDRGLRRTATAGIGVVAAIGLLQPVARSWRERRDIAALGAAPEGGAPNVLLIILDTVRAASLSLYGFPWPTTPTLERLAESGTTFDWAIAPAPWTLPTHASIFSGVYPGELTADWTVPMDKHTPVLAEAFRERGYHTAAVVANLDYTAWDSGLQRGFAHFVDYPVAWRQLLFSSSYAQTATGRRLLGARSMADVRLALSDLDLSIDPKHVGAPRRADAVTHEFLDWQAEHRDRPFFAFLNYFDAHQGYFAPESFPEVGDPSRKAIRYTTAINWIDQNLDTLFTELQSRGALDNTIVIVTSDHGELFDEHGLRGHANSLYRNLLRVPLLVRYPAAVPAARRITRQVSLRDLAATIVDLGALPAGTFPGRSLRAAWQPAGDSLSDVVAELRQAPNVSETQPNAKGGLAAWFDDSTHYIRHLPNRREEAFDYRRDTTESRDLAGDLTRLGPVRAALDVHFAGRKAPAPRRPAP
ncbi:MAG: sulfatase-like hydrolase/transferase [Gemmatimonadetes bacterium]|nr:sulfatase-like hydrolase/transferase [Gemmatimonadota bacterium]